MAIILKEETTLNNLVKELERKKKKIQEDRFEINKRIKEIDRRISLIKKKYEKKGKKEFNRKLGWIYLVLLLTTAASCCFIYHFNNYSDINFLFIMATISLFFVIVIYFKARSSYLNRFLYKTTGEDITQTVIERDILYKNSKNILLEEARLINEISDHGAEIAGNKGEQAVINYIKENFNNDAYLINDVRVRYRDRTTQLDHVLVCPQGIFCLETKNYGFTYYKTSDDKWMFYKGKEKVVINSPVSQSVYHAEMLLGAFPGRCQRIVPLVIFTNRNGIFVGSDDRCKVIRTKELLRTVHRYKKIWSPEETKDVAYKVLALNVG